MGKLSDNFLLIPVNSYTVFYFILCTVITSAFLNLHLLKRNPS